MRLYDNIAYFELVKDLPCAPVGTQVIIKESESDPALKIISDIGTIVLPYEAAIHSSEWFKPISFEEQRSRFDSSIKEAAQARAPEATPDQVNATAARVTSNLFTESTRSANPSQYHEDYVTTEFNDPFKKIVSVENDPESPETA